MVACTLSEVRERKQTNYHQKASKAYNLLELGVKPSEPQQTDFKL